MKTTKYETASMWFSKAVLLPTPIAGDWKGPGRKDGSGSTLSARIALLSELLAGNSGGGTKREDKNYIKQQ